MILVGKADILLLVTLPSQCPEILLPLPESVNDNLLKSLRLIHQS